MSEERIYPEKEHDEKEEEHMEEKWRKDPFSALFFGLIVISAGVFLLMAARGIIEWGDWWAYLFLAIGCILIIDAFARYAVPARRRPIFGKVFFGLILICIGGSNIYGLEEWWPLILIIVGVLIIVYGMTRTRKPK
jgi:peptidoglycan/LPS O-acetylase OafA/YrhL